MSKILDPFGSEPPAHRWKEPVRSVASRRPSEKPNAAARSIMVTAADNRELLCESALEERAALILEANPDCARIYEQPPAVCYRDYEGVQRRHTFDFLVVLRSSERIAVAVKPAAVARKRGLETLLRHIGAQMDPKFATGWLLLTDEKMPRIAVANARAIHNAKLSKDEDLDNRVRHALRLLNGATSIRSIVRLAGLEGHEQGFHAVLRAIGSGLISPVDQGIFGPDTVVRLGHGGRP